jgi:hypothetical protein
MFLVRASKTVVLPDCGRPMMPSFMGESCGFGCERLDRYDGLDRYDRS